MGKNLMEGTKKAALKMRLDDWKYAV